MIHLHHEGLAFKLGLNITYLSPFHSIAFTWCWFDPRSAVMSIRRLRFRRTIKPHVIVRKHAWDFVEERLYSKGKVAITRELAEDYLPPEHLKKLYPEDTPEAGGDPALKRWWEKRRAP